MIALTPVGTVRSSRSDLSDDGWDRVPEASIERRSRHPRRDRQPSWATELMAGYWA
jgi:hypothetical protein